MELAYFGFNAATVGFLGTLVFVVVQVWGLWKQHKRIQKKASGESISVGWYIYDLIAFAIVLIYGISRDRIAMIIDGFFVGAFHIPALISLWKYKGYRAWEKALAVIGFPIIALVILHPAKDWFLLVSLVIGLIATVLPPIEILLNRKRGDVDVRVSLTFGSSTVFWSIYAFATDDWVLSICCPIYVVLHLLTVILWGVFPNPEDDSVS